jgi:hypothetical protein
LIGRTHLPLVKDAPTAQSREAIGSILPYRPSADYTIVMSGSDLRQGGGPGVERELRRERTRKAIDKRD